MISTPLFMSLERIDRLVLGLRDAYGESRLDAASLLTRVARIMAKGASSSQERTAFLRAALRKAFAEHSVEGAALRSNIATLVEGGEMRPSAAESWATTFGWRPFAGWADPALFDPMTQEFWTLPMTAAWIENHDREFVSAEDQLRLEADRRAAYEETDRLHEYVPISDSAIRKNVRERNLEQVVECVRRHWSTYLAESTHWIEVEHPILPDDEYQPLVRDDAASRVMERVKRGYVVGPREDRGWSDVPGEKTTTKHLLCEALASGQLKVERFVNGEFAVIPHEEWSALNDESSAIRIVGLLNDDGVYDSAGVYKAVAPDGNDYPGVRVPRKQVMSAFPFSATEQKGSAGSRRPISHPDTVKFIKDRIAKTGRVPAGDVILNELRGMNRIPDQDFVRQTIRELSGGRGPGRQPR